MLNHLNKIASKPKRVVVIGAGGFVGAEVVKNLQSKSVPTVALSRNELDLLQPGAINILSGLIQDGDAIVMLATIAPCKNAQQLIENLQMMQVVCEVIRLKSTLISHVVYISSDAVYADDVSLANENSVQQPSSFHGMMHTARELMAKSGVGSIPLAILRPSLLYGINDPHNGYGPNRFVRLVADGKDIGLFGGGEEQRDHIAVEDVAELIVQVLLHKSQGVMNIATGRSYSFKDVADLIIRLSNSESKVIPSVRQNPITHRHFDITVSQQVFPHFKYIELENGISRVLEASVSMVT